MPKTLNHKLVDSYKAASIEMRKDPLYQVQYDKIVQTMTTRACNADRSTYRVKVPAGFIWTMFDQLIEDGFKVQLLLGLNELEISLCYQPKSNAEL